MDNLITVRWCFISIVFLCVLVVECHGANVGDLRTYSTRHSIGIEWDVEGDNNHNAQCSVEYRLGGNSATPWNNGLPLYRVDFKNYDMLAGSIFHLKPGRNYQVRLQFSDPDGGNTTQIFSISTLTQPAMPQNGRTLYVVPGSGGGSGTLSDPFQGIEAALGHVVPGDTVLLGGGNYSGVLIAFVLSY